VTCDRVRGGQVVQARWHVVVPAAAHLGQAPITVQAVYTAEGQRGVTYGSVSVLSAYATLADAFDNAGISADSDVTADDFDGTGTSYSEEARSRSLGRLLPPQTDAASAEEDLGLGVALRRDQL
jgi:hypothetical protein